MTIALKHRTAGNNAIRLIRDAYLGNPLPDAEYRPVDCTLACRIALAYEALPVTPASRNLLQDALRAYTAFIAEVDRQFEAILESSHAVQFTDEDPYTDSAAMMADLRDTCRLLVYRTDPEQAHPFLTPTQNERFRAVHDFFGHAMEGFQFGPRGEDNAWREHARMFSASAIPALTTETRGQNSWVNFLPRHEPIPPRERPYAKQKFGLLPLFAYDDK